MPEYNPEWDDYVIDRRPNLEVKALVSVLMKQHEPIIKKLGLNLPTFFYVKGSGALAVYIAGSSAESVGGPVILIDSKGIAKATKECDCSLGFAIESTMIHEYGHAYLESNGLDTPYHNEDVVESFARDTLDYSLAVALPALDKFLDKQL